MGLNFKALNEAQEELTSRSGGDGLFFYQKEIGRETDIRILPNFPNMDGKYYLEVVAYWINGKKYTSPETFGKPCPIAELAEEAKTSGDKDLKALIEDKDNFQKRYEYLMPILLLDVKIEGQEVVDIKVKDGKAKILSCGSMLMKRINKIVCSRKYMNGTPDGITDREKGFNLILSKVGEKLNTEYDAEGAEQWEFDEKYYKDYPNVVDLTEKAIYPDEYLEGVMRNYLYGEPMPEEPKRDKDKDEKPARKETASGRTSRSSKSEEKEEKPSRTARSSRSSKAEKEEETEEKEDKKDTGKSSGRRNFLADLKNLD